MHADHLDRPLRMTNSAQSVVWDAVYNPSGDVNSITGSVTNNLRFPGQYFLIEDGLHYNWYRHYDPTIGRYIQPDPLGFVSRASRYSYVPDPSGFVNGASLYSYVGSNPLQRVDPLGLWTVQLGGTISLNFLGGFAVQYTAGIVIDGNGNVGTYQSAGFGAGVGADASGGFTVAWSNADNICSLQGPFVNLNTGTGEGIQAGADSFYGLDQNNNAIMGAGIILGVGLGAGFSVTTTVTGVNPF